MNFTAENRTVSLPEETYTDVLKGTRKKALSNWFHTERAFCGEAAKPRKPHSSGRRFVQNAAASRKMTAEVYANTP